MHLTFDRNKAATASTSDKAHIVSTSNSSNSPTGSSTNSNLNTQYHSQLHATNFNPHTDITRNPRNLVQQQQTRNSNSLQKQRVAIQQTHNSKHNSTRKSTANHTSIHPNQSIHSNQVPTIPTLNSTNTSSATTSLDANSNSNHPSEGYHSNGVNNVTVAVTNQLWNAGMPQSAINSHMIETPLEMRKPMALSTFRADDTSDEVDEDETQHFLNTNDHYNPGRVGVQDIQIQGLEPQTTTFQQHSPNYPQIATNYQQNSTSTFQPLQGLPPPNHEVLNDNFESTFSDSQQNSPNNQPPPQNLIRNHVQTDIQYNMYHNQDVTMHQPPPTLVHNSKTQQYDNNNYQKTSNNSPPSLSPLSPQSQHYNQLSPANVETFQTVGNVSKLSPAGQNKINHVKTSREKASGGQCCNIVFTAIGTFACTCLFFAVLTYFLFKPMWYDPIASKALHYAPKNGYWLEWTQWSECGKLETDKTRCGDQTRKRYCEGIEDGGRNCNGSDIETRSCQHPDCRCRHRVIAGQIKDSRNDEFLSFVQVLMSNTTRVIAQTDSNGKFTVTGMCNNANPDGAMHLDFYLRGYYPKTGEEMKPMLEKTALNGGLSKIRLDRANAPVITSSPSSSYRLAGQSVKMCCGFQMDNGHKSEYKVHWYRNGMRLNPKKYKYSVGEPDLLLSSLTTQKNQGNYECTVSNTGGTVRSSAASLKIFDDENELCQVKPKMRKFCRSSRTIDVGECTTPEIENVPYGMCLTREQHQSVDNERCDNRYGIEGLVNGFTGGQGNNKREEVERATGVCCQADETDKELIDCDDDGTTYQITVDIIRSCSCRPC